MMKQINKQELIASMHSQGYAHVKSFIADKECQLLRDGFEVDAHFRKTVIMERYRFGLGVYKYYRYPLPSLISNLRQSLYSLLAPVANEWMSRLNIEKNYPSDWNEFKADCESKGQHQPTPLILKYGEGGFNTLHQDIYGEVFFPIQVVLNLTSPGGDYEGGEFVLTEQIPRAQSKAIVLQPGLGDMVIFTTNFRPVKGSKGFYKANMRHGVSPITRGTRVTLGIIFHDAES